MVNIITMLIVGAVVGWIAGQIVQTRGGILLDILVGVMGSALATFIFQRDTFVTGNFSLSSLLWSLIGAVVLMFFMKIIMRNPLE